MLHFQEICSVLGQGNRLPQPAEWGVTNSFKACESSVTLCAFTRGYIVQMTKGYDRCPCRASMHPSDPCEELLGQSETRPLHHRCPPPGRTAPEATPLYTRRYATLKTQMESSLCKYWTRPLCVSPTIWWCRVDERLPAVDAHAALVVEQGVVGGTAVAHHALYQVLQ